ncbi:GNAT family N-acetyltransferase [Sphingobacterium siyangense]|uniref:RimJ/RimL family protein N-acetyltransferase n=1 Tax=Sphingobacterium siyangense TaxID=459529 RepID=A0A562M9S7_9SPHI|nr:GNAT family protein [Sphingobacterium siyangense]TWI16663.1 RimJ/RimL family protein N-acetyltransferase [Sphingobacterium siyangense]
MEIKTERLKLRSVEKIDLENIHSLLMYPESALFNPSGFPDGIAHTAQMVEAWSAQIHESDVRKDYTFYIETLEGKEFIGLINISVVKLRYRNAEVWFKLVPTMWNKGYATEALNRILTFGFKELNFHRIEGGCAVENIASAKVMEKVGMVKEARRRKILPLKDGWSDNYEFAILEEEYPL